MMFILFVLKFDIVGPTCPTGYTVQIGESDGRSCYGISSSPGVSGDSVSVCQAGDQDLRRPALPTHREIIQNMKPPM